MEKKKRKRKLTLTRRRSINGYLFILPWLIGFLAFYFTLRPLLNRIYAPLIKIFKFFVEKLLKFARRLLYNVINISRSVCTHICGFIKSKVIVYGRKKESTVPRRKRGKYKRSKPEKTKA